MRLRGILRGQDVRPFAAWLQDADRCGVYGMRRFVRTLRQDLDAVRNAITEPWSNGQTEGQINPLKTLKRAMYAGIHAMRQFAATLRRDLVAVRNAIMEPWSNGQTEGQIVSVV